MALRGGCFVPEEAVPAITEEVIPTVLGSVLPLIPTIGTLDAWPVGSIYSTKSEADPADIFGGGTWVSIPGGGMGVHQWERTG
jgi:hypothetical protein